MIRLLLLCIVLLPTFANAQSWPSKTIRIIVSVPAGSLQDALARSVAQHLTDTYHQPVIVENRPGANTIIAAQAALQSAPDGYTFLVGTDSTISINPFAYAKLPYDPEKDFVPVTLIAHAVEVMFVPSELAVNSVRDFIEMAKASPGKMNYGSFGLASNAHLDALMLEQATGIHMVHVPYKGGADAVPALATNQIQLLITAIGVGMPALKSGKVKVLAVPGARRHRLLPNVPTFTEAGYPQLNFGAWWGLVARAGTPDDVINRLASDVSNYVKSRAFTDRFATSYAIDADGITPAEFAAFLKADREKYGPIVKSGNVRLD